MSTLETFLAYARDFERTYADDDWARLDRYFADDAVYEVAEVSYACRLEGRDAIFRGIRRSLDRFDRRMDDRTIEVTSPPRVEGEEMAVGWAVTYRLGDAPPIRVAATSRATVRDGRIVALEDRYEEGQDALLREWLEAHAPELDPSYVDGAPRSAGNRTNVAGTESASHTRSFPR